MSVPRGSKARISVLSHPRDLQKKEKIGGMRWYGGEGGDMVLTQLHYTFLFLLGLSHSHRTSSCSVSFFTENISDLELHLFL